MSVGLVLNFGHIFLCKNPTSYISLWKEISKIIFHVSFFGQVFPMPTSFRITLPPALNSTGCADFHFRKVHFFDNMEKFFQKLLEILKLHDIMVQIITSIFVFISAYLPIFSIHALRVSSWHGSVINHTTETREILWPVLRINYSRARTMTPHMKFSIIHVHYTHTTTYRDTYYNFFTFFLPFFRKEGKKNKVK